ncbi:hypothetical protein GA0116948_12513 [Chitinophaga costaii]|uniref:Uncharacterized protein n=1 Tax=Chitinophaga costaii TaxID=1335309 RepID=A0A1C4G6S6_9BACT|nr:hypothetical protein GA0116948_12513 [Chitinophaga costaii]
MPKGSNSKISPSTINSRVFNQIKRTPGSENNFSKPEAYLNVVLFDYPFNMVIKATE